MNTLNAQDAIPRTPERQTTAEDVDYHWRQQRNGEGKEERRTIKISRETKGNTSKTS